MSELTEETAKELIAAINRLALIIKPVPAAPAEPEKKELTPRQIKQQQKMAARERMHKEVEEHVKEHFKRVGENWKIQQRVHEENNGTATGSTEQYLNGLSHRERVYYDRVKYPYNKRGNSKKDK